MLNIKKLEEKGLDSLCLKVYRHSNFMVKKGTCFIPD